MGYLMVNGKYNYFRSSDGEWKREQLKKGLQLTTSFRGGLRFRKARDGFRCRECQKAKPKGTRYLCKEYEKVCVDCATKWANYSIETFKEIIELLEKSKIELLENNDKWRREMILGAVS